MAFLSLKKNGTKWECVVNSSFFLQMDIELFNDVFVYCALIIMCVCVFNGIVSV